MILRISDSSIKRLKHKMELEGGYGEKIKKVDIEAEIEEWIDEYTG